MLYRIGADKLEQNREGRILKIDPLCPVFERLTELGFSKGSTIKCVVRRKGIGAFYLKGTVIALRDEDSKDILVLTGENDE